MKYMGRLGTKLVRNAADRAVDETGARKGLHRGRPDTIPASESASELDGFDSDGAPCLTACCLAVAGKLDPRSATILARLPDHGKSV